MDRATSALLPFLLLLALLAVPVYSKGHDDHDERIEMAANQTSQCNSCCRGPPGRDGRDGPPGPSSPISLRDYHFIKAELEEDLKNQISTGINANYTTSDEYCKDIGKIQDKPASCKAIFDCNNQSPSGQYWIRIEEDKKIVIKSIYCNMEDTKCGIRGGWMRVAHIDMTNPSATCPPPLRTITSPKRMCGRATSDSPGCSSVMFPSCGVPYTRVCGRAVGYAYYTPNSFEPKANGINGAYVDGLSITHGQPRKHIWTYAAGLSEDGNYPLWNCPCTVHPGPSPPSFVGDHYHCEAGNTGGWESQWYTSDPLWDGKGCDAGSSCCSTSGLPWFCRTLPCETTDDIEVRWCADYAISDEDVSTELLEIYVL